MKFKKEKHLNILVLAILAMLAGYLKGYKIAIYALLAGSFIGIIYKFGFILLAKRENKNEKREYE